MVIPGGVIGVESISNVIFPLAGQSVVYVLKVRSRSLSHLIVQPSVQAGSRYGHWLTCTVFTSRLTWSRLLTPCRYAGSARTALQPNVIVHPSGKLVIQSFFSCIAKLMQGSALEMHVVAAYGGLTGKFSGKS